MPSSAPLNFESNKFIQRALIHSFKSSHAPQPSAKEDYNDDFSVESYTSTARSYAGKQRKGLQEEHSDSSSMEEHAKEAITAPFFLSLQTPLPQAITHALNFISSTPHTAIRDFWRKQLHLTEKLVSDASSCDSAWNERIPLRLRASAGRLKLAPLISLLYQHNLGGSTWLQQFIFGFKLTGIFSQKYAFPVTHKLLSKTPLKLNRIMRSNSSRFSDRAKKSGFKSAQALWKEAVEQQGKGWLSPPFP